MSHTLIVQCILNLWYKIFLQGAQDPTNKIEIKNSWFNEQAH